MRILVSGSHGLIATALIPLLEDDGHEIVRLVRADPARRSSEIQWDPSRGTIDGDRLEGVEAVFHLAGESIAGMRWTAAKKQRIRESRVKGTALLANALKALDRPPSAMICSSAVGYYGDRGDEVLTESSAAGRGFLADLCHDWEAATAPAGERGIRVVNLRFGVVLSTDGGALKEVLRPFKLGFGGKLGSGRQYFSWIALGDAAAALRFALDSDRMIGPVNAVAPQQVTNREYTKALGSALRRPTVFGIPAFVARAAFGELADEALLASQRVEPAKLEAAGFQFKYPDLGDALRALLKADGS